MLWWINVIQGIFSPPHPYKREPEIVKKCLILGKKLLR